MIIIEFLAGIILLAFGADRFLKSSQALANRMGLPATVTGVILVGFGTSFSEIVVAAVAAAHNKSLLAVGNVFGSNIANIGLVMGLGALLMPMMVSSHFIRREFPAMILVTVLVGFLLWPGHLGIIAGIVLLIFLVIHLGVTFIFAPKDPVIQKESKELSAKPFMNMPLAIFFWILGLALLYISSEMIVASATAIAQWLHVSELMIGLTVVAVGTSLPELATIMFSAYKKEYDIAVGSILGSNIFNLLAVLAMPALIAPVKLPDNFMHIDYPILLAFTLLFTVFAFFPKKEKWISRLEGGLLIIAYVGYLLIMIY